MPETSLINLFKEGLNTNIEEKSRIHKNIILSGVGGFSSKVFLVADFLKIRKDFQKVVWVVNDQAEQELIVKSLSKWTGLKVLSLELPDVNSPGKDDQLEYKIKLIELISTLNSEEKCIIVTTYENLLRKTPNLEELKKKEVLIKRLSERKIMRVFEDLINIGYEVSEDSNLIKGQYRRHGGILEIFPINCDHPVRIEADFESLGDMIMYNKNKEYIEKINEINIYPLNINFDSNDILRLLNEKCLFIDDEIEVFEDYTDTWDSVLKSKQCPTITFTPFLEEGDNHLNLFYFSVLRYHSLNDLINDIKEKKKTGWMTVIFTKHYSEFEGVFREKNIFFLNKKDKNIEKGEVMVYEVDKDEIVPYSFQNPHLKIICIGDRELAAFKDDAIKTKALNQKLYLDFLTSLKLNDYVVHQDHGIAVFQGLVKKTVDNVTREYLKLGYAENDKLFIPIDQADKVNKYIGDEGQIPKLTRLGSTEWVTLTNRVKKETQQIAKELLVLYAQRETAKGFAFKKDTGPQDKFENTFPYEETPGQIRAIMDVKKDMESEKPMDRLVCGDVGFGKTEVAMRAAFKAVQDKKQVALISPITILTDQHYRSFMKRMDEFNVRIEMLSRFKKKKDQKEILKKMEKGEVDIVVGTHRLIQADIKFKNLGLVIIDEEQRFGVKQKEELKKLRTEVDILTLTATPIPRTLNLSLNKLRDISIITTPPPGRLPIITEVRRYSNDLIREVILREIERKGQIYFLHNRVQTIDSVAEKLKSLVPEAKFIVSHGKLSASELEKNIIAFKEGRYDVLVSSTIIENGIDLPNANTLIVNNAERFGLAQLYQLRGRVGRSRKQAYAYFLYHSQRLKYDAKKRLRAIVDASELGSGFQIAMKDLEIRGAGDILGANQHGAINIVGVSHFIRMLNKAVEDLKEGRPEKESEEPIEVTVELPLTCYIPDSYIVNSKDKINVYQKLASADNYKYLNELKDELIEEYGKMPPEVANLFKVLDLKIIAKKAGILNVKVENIHDTEDREIILHMSNKVRPENIMNLLNYNEKWIISGTKLKIKTKKLGVNWYEELKKAMEKLAEKVDKKALELSVKNTVNKA